MIALVEMSLRNFKGTKELDVRFDGKSAVVSGPNACGKTTIADAYLWIVNGTTYADGRKVEDTIKLSDESGNQTVDGGIEHSVEATLDVDGKTKILKKVFYEEWKKKRGSENKEMSGHRTKYFIDGMPTSASVYSKNIEHLGGDTLSMVGRPQSFAELETKKRRKALLELIGGEQMPEVDDASIARYIDTYGGINEALDAVSHELTSTNKSLEEFPVRIDEATKTVPAEIDTTALSAKLDELEKSKAALLGKISRLEEGGDASAELREKLLSLKEKKKDLEINSMMGDRKELDEMYRIRNDQRARKEKRESEISSIKADIERTKTENRQIAQQWKEIKNLTYEPKDTCPYCGQDLPQEMKDKAVERFNLQKAERLSKFGRDGKMTMERIKDLSSKLAVEEDCLNVTLNEMDATNVNIELLEARLKQAENSPEMDAIEDEITIVKAQIDEARTGSQTALDDLRVTLDGLNKEISVVNTKLSGGKLRENALKRIEELKKQQKEVARKYDDLIDVKAGMESVVKAMVDSMEQKVASVFRYARFCMYKKQINGGISQCCEVLNHEGVPMTAANTASRITTNLDIARAIAEHAGIQCPVFVDNAESINNIPDIGMQMIQLKVTEEDGLHVHLEEQEGA